MQLTERQERILKAIVDRYVAGAHPIGSAALLESAGLNVSAATVRNEMAALEDLGYLRQLHTSGGRVPTNTGYRYYVERLMERSQLSHSEANTIRHQFHQAPTELQEWLKLAATVMARSMHNVGLVTAPKSSEFHLRHLEVISIQNSVALVIVVLADGAVLQEMVALVEPRNQEELSPLADRLSQALRGSTASEIEARIASFSALDGIIAAVTAHLMRRGEEQHAQIFHAGLPDLIGQPEFGGRRTGESQGMSQERLRHVVEFLHQGLGVQQLLAGLPAEARVQIVIGDDTPTRGMEDYSFVLGRYGHEDESNGFLGVVGPTRMEYTRAEALVRYMTALMTDLMQAH